MVNSFAERIGDYISMQQDKERAINRSFRLRNSEVSSRNTQNVNRLLKILRTRYRREPPSLQAGNNGGGNVVKKHQRRCCRTDDCQDSFGQFLIAEAVDTDQIGKRFNIPEDLLVPASDQGSVCIPDRSSCHLGVKRGAPSSKTSDQIILELFPASQLKKTSHLYQKTKGS